MLRNFSKKAFSLIEISIVILIIGILIAGITSGSKLYSKFKLQTARSLTKSSPVNGIKDLVLWYETSLDESFGINQNFNNNPIGQWNDINPQKPIKNSATQNIGSSQPAFLEDDLNGIPAINFDGTNDFMTFNGSDFINTSYTIFVVAKRTYINSWNFIITADGCTTNRNLILGYADQINSAWSSQCGNDVGRSLPTYTQPVAHILSAWFTKRNVTFPRTLRVNGAGPSTISNTSPVIALPSNLLRIYQNINLYSH